MCATFAQQPAIYMGQRNQNPIPDPLSIADLWVILSKHPLHGNKSGPQFSNQGVHPVNEFRRQAAPV